MRKKNSHTRRRHTAGPIFILIFILFFMPVLGLAVVPKAPEISDHYTKSCLDTDVLRITSNVTYSNATSSEYIETSLDKTCQNGCSSILNDCRYNKFYEASFFVGILFVLGIVVYFAPRLGPVGAVAAITSIVVSIYVATWDVFTAPFDLITRLLPIALAVYVGFHFFFAKPEDEDD